MSLLRTIGRRLWAAYRGFQEHDGTLSAAGVAYYVALSFFPLLMVLVAGLGWVLELTAAGQEAQQQLILALEQQASANLAEQVQRSLKVVREQAPSGGPIGFIVLMVSAVAIFAQLDSSFDRIFRVPSDPHETWLHWLWNLVFQRIKALGMLIGVGGFIIVVMVASTVWTALEAAMESAVHIAPWFRWLSSFWINLLLNLLGFTLIYRTMPKPRIRWSQAVQGGILAALLWEAGRQVLALYLLRLNYPNAYGVIGSFLAVMLWAYYGALVILFGAEYVRALREEGDSLRQKGLNLHE